MKTKTVKQKEKEKHQLIFKYLKTLTPYSPNPQNEVYLHKLRKGQLGIHQPSCLLNSKVYDINIAAVHSHRKRVSFVEVEKESKVEGETRRKDKRSKSNALSSQIIQTKQVAKMTPMTVQNDLLQLQRSVFSAFKIRPQESRYSSYRPERSDAIVRDIASQTIVDARPLVQSKVIRAKSASSISHLKLQSQAKQSQTKTSLNLKGSASSSGLSRSQTFQDPKPSQFSQQLSSRSTIYSQQSHNLMVEIFKHKLKTKFPS